MEHKTTEIMSKSSAQKSKFLTKTKFEELELPESVLKGLNKIGLIYCTEIQAQVLPLSLKGLDIAGQSQTGTGKTAAFLVTIFTRLKKLKEKKTGLPLALIVAPTRELAFQIYQDAQLLGLETGFEAAIIVGGIDYQKQIQKLKEGVDIVICTPGRVIDYIKQGIFKTSGVKILVIDEADRLFDLGFTKDMRFIMKRLPGYQKRQTMLFSATLSFRVMELTYEYMNLPEFISVTPSEITVKGVDQTLFHVEKAKKLSLLLGILDIEKLQRGLIFVNTKAGVEWLSKKLKGNNWPVQGITGDLPQQKRFKLMESFKKGTVKLLIATDVASRGIHVEDITHVINYDLPQDPENYIHRIGRTARAGKKGKAISFACEEYVYHLEQIEKLIGESIQVEWPEDDCFFKDNAGHIASDNKKYKNGKKYAKKKKDPDVSLKPSRKSSEDYFPGTFFGFKPRPDNTDNP